MNETKKMGFWQKVKARRLANTVYVMFVFTLLFLASVFGFYIAQDGTVAKEIFLGLFTSLLASICIIAFEFYTKYKDFENSEFIDNLYSFGIHNLYFNKQDVLAERIDSATQEIWISGYRLILTAELLPNIANALDRGCKLRILCCPPFTDSYRLIFGSENENKAIINNYFKLLEIVTSRHADFHEQCVIRFTETPLFNDTYKVDDKIITSPYMHNKDIIHGTILAKDFFTYELDEKYRLYQLMKDEFETLFENAKYTIDENTLASAVNSYKNNDLNESQKYKCLQDALVEIGKQKDTVM